MVYTGTRATLHRSLFDAQVCTKLLELANMLAPRTKTFNVQHTGHVHLFLKDAILNPKPNSPAMQALHAKHREAPFLCLASNRINTGWRNV